MARHQERVNFYTSMRKVILITGISSGFGKQTSRMLAEKGHAVYGTVRKICAADGDVNVLVMDLTDIDSIKRTVRDVVEKEGRIDVLINNAGMHTGGAVETTPAQNIRLQMETSFMGMVNLTREVLPVMRNIGGGIIINISSIGGLMGLPFQAFYSAAKFAVEGFSEALRMETGRFNIRVVVINPGDFHTNNSSNRRGYLAPSGPDDPYHEQFEKTLTVIENDEASSRDPAVLASRLVRIVECSNPRNRYVIASADQKLAVLLKKIVPGKIFASILASHYLIRRRMN